jgi:hypothetical protein
VIDVSNVVVVDGMGWEELLSDVVVMEECSIA